MDKLFFTIKEASSIVKIEPYILRYWESEFGCIQPKRTRAGHRRYKKEDIETILNIKKLLYEQGFTISGAKKYLALKKEPSSEIVNEIKEELKDVLKLIQI
ncbi:TPA: MerR family transcriptional regulator [bacterium]|nr:MerR family transcriptional regulator [bacterium]